MPAMYMPKGSIIGVMSKAVSFNKPSGTDPNWQDLSEHQRSPLSVSYERIGDSHRTSSGMLRKWYVADKRSFSTSWENLPHTSSKTVDGKMGASELEAFHLANTGDYWLRVREPGGTFTVYRVITKDFSKSISKRGTYEFWDIDFSVEEV